MMVKLLLPNAKDLKYSVLEMKQETDIYSRNRKLFETVLRI